MRGVNVCAIPVATAAPFRPIPKGKMKSQSRKIFVAVLMIAAAITSIGEPSLRTKNWNRVESAEGIIKMEYQKR